MKSKFSRSERPQSFRKEQRPFSKKPGTSSGLLRIYGRKPVLEALKLGIVQSLDIAPSGHGQIIETILREAPKHNVIPVRREIYEPDKAINHQGVAAQIHAPRVRHDLEDFLDDVPQTPIPLLLMLDGILDPHNYGAILRSACAANVTGVIVRERRQAPLTDIVFKASAGAAALIPIFEVTNLSQTLRMLKEREFWSAAADRSDDAISFSNYDWTLPTVLILGAEGEGVSELLLKSADRKIVIPMSDMIDSLNVSVAAGILLLAAVEKRGVANS